MNDQIGSGGPDRPGPAEPLPDLYAAQITGSREALAKLLQTFELDVGCRHPHVEPTTDRAAVMLVYATRERIGEIQAAGYKVEIGENVSAVGRERQAEVGKGDRFEGGRVVPHGLGGKPGGERKGGAGQ